MVENKIHRPLTDSELLTIVESTEEELSKACTTLDATSHGILDGVFEPGVFARLLAEKKLSRSTIKIGEERAFVLIHGFNAAGWLVIEGAIALGRRPIKDLLDGSYALARHFGAPKIVFITKLKALYQYVIDHNFKTVGVMLCSEVPQ
jgi:hypothetical protein